MEDVDEGDGDEGIKEGEELLEKPGSEEEKEETMEI